MGYDSALCPVEIYLAPFSFFASSRRSGSPSTSGTFCLSLPWKILRSCAKEVPAVSLGMLRYQGMVRVSHPGHVVLQCPKSCTGQLPVQWIVNVGVLSLLFIILVLEALSWDLCISVPRNIICSYDLVFTTDHLGELIAMLNAQKAGKGKGLHVNMQKTTFPVTGFVLMSPRNLIWYVLLYCLSQWSRQQLHWVFEMQSVVPKEVQQNYWSTGGWTRLHLI